MIYVRGIGKTFRLYRKPSDRLKEIFFRKPFHANHRALDNVSFQVEDGETLGIIGQNGAGKSTLLKIITGVLLADTGQIDSDGRITGLLELGTGFNISQTGAENIYSNGLLLGMGQEEIADKYQAIVAFSELGNFIDEPLRTYSSGMGMRLAFSIAIHAEPQCFLVDEALAVGDAHFQQKCLRRLRDFREQGGSVLLVSHDINAVKMLCDRAILLDHGKVLTEGSPEEVVNAYYFLLAKRNDQEVTLTFNDPQSQDYGNQEVEIIDVEIRGQGSGCAMISAGETATIQILIRAHRDMENVTVGFLIRDRYGQDIFGTNSHHLNYPITLHQGQSQTILYTLAMDIGFGKYTLTAAVHQGPNHLESCYHWRDQVANFEIVGHQGPMFAGVCKLHPTLSIPPHSNSHGRNTYSLHLG